MTNTGAAKLRETRAVDTVLTEAVRNRTRTATRETANEADSRFASIQTNTFHQIMFARDLSPEAKKDAMTQAISFIGTKEETRTRIAEYELFKEFLQSKREEMEVQIMKLTDTEAYSELKSVIEGLNGGMLDFEERMTPLIEIIDAIYVLRTNGLTYDAFKEIRDERNLEDEYNEKRSDITTRFNTLNNDITNLQNEIATLGEQKSFFGFGGVTQEAREAISRKNLELTTAQNNLATLQSELIALNVERAERQSKNGEFAAEKAKLRELLDISSDDHKERQKGLVSSALNFVTVSKERIGSIRDHFGKMDSQIENLVDANSTMLKIYAIMGEATKEAEQKNQEIRASLEAPEGDENMIAKITREEKKMAVEEHIELLNTSTADTTMTFADLSSKAIRIKGMKDANSSQMAKVRTMHSQGVAGIADRLNVVLQAVSAAALGESSSIAKDTLTRMTDSTNKISQKESIRQAMSGAEINADLEKALDDLDAYGEVVRAATDITRENVTEMRSKLDELQNLAKSVQGDVKEAYAVHADVGMGEQKKEKASTNSSSNDPFNFAA
jgi:hypothetical protein